MITSEMVLAVIGVVFLMLQFVFRADSRKIVKSTVESFDKHVTESTEIHTMISNLSKAHDVKDSEGRPMWYMPPSVISTQTEMVKIMTLLAQTQQTTVAILERLERNLDQDRANDFPDRA
jgi:hypothetical protein